MPTWVVKSTLLIVLAAVTAAAQRTNWANVKTLPIGGEIRVSLVDGKSYRGQVQNVTDESLIIVAASSQETLARAQVRKVATKGEGHRSSAQHPPRRGHRSRRGLGHRRGHGCAMLPPLLSRQQPRKSNLHPTRRTRRNRRRRSLAHRPLARNLPFKIACLILTPVS